MYIPYMRVRQKCVLKCKAPVKTILRNMLITIRCLVCAAFLLVTIINAGNKSELIFLSIFENNAADLINECIDKGVYNAKKYFKGNDFFIISQNTNNQILSVKNNVLEANMFAQTLSECIHNEIKDIEKTRCGHFKPSFMENGLFSAVFSNIPYRIAHKGKVMVTPGFSIEKDEFDHIIHRLEMEISLNVRINISILGKEKVLNRKLLISETVISCDNKNN